MNVEKTKVVRISRHPSPVQMIDQEQLENVEYFNYLGIMITTDARFTRRRLSTSKLDVHLRQKLSATAGA